MHVQGQGGGGGGRAVNSTREQPRGRYNDGYERRGNEQSSPNKIIISSTRSDFHPFLPSSLVGGFLLRADRAANNRGVFRKASENANMWVTAPWLASQETIGVRGMYPLDRYYVPYSLVNIILGDVCAISSRECISRFPRWEPNWKKEEKPQTKLKRKWLVRAELVRVRARLEHSLRGVTYIRTARCIIDTATPNVARHRRPPLCPPLFEIGQVCVHVVCASIYAHMCDWVPGGVPQTCPINRLFSLSTAEHLRQDCFKILTIPFPYNNFIRSKFR